MKRAFFTLLSCPTFKKELRKCSLIFQFTFMGGPQLHVWQSFDFIDVGFLPDRSDG